ncbi:hypothetical protein [Faecalimonas sp.]
MKNFKRGLCGITAGILLFQYSGIAYAADCGEIAEINVTNETYTEISDEELEKYLVSELGKGNSDERFVGWEGDLHDTMYFWKRTKTGRCIAYEVAECIIKYRGK